MFRVKDPPKLMLWRAKLENRNNLWLVLYFLSANLDILFWWFNGAVTPVLIPNTEVKLASGDGSCCYRQRE